MRKIALINGSPKSRESASEILLDAVKSNLTDCDITEFNVRTPDFKDIEIICENEILVFAFPLYVDGVPSHLLNFLYQLELFLKHRESGISVYVIVNCGFYEGKQNKNALEIMENWCIKSNLTWGQGIGIGGGGIISGIKKVAANGPMKDIAAALANQSNLILHRQCAENAYVSPNFPRILYKIAAEMEWRRQIKANGLKAKDLFRQIP